MKAFFWSFILLHVPMLSRAQDTGEISRLLKLLQSPDTEDRRVAMHDLQTSLDPRIPDACLAVLSQEGDSVRRMAARAIGSRWHQIPEDRAAVFIAALKPHLGSEHDGLANMASRGIALLSRDFHNPMLALSKSSRWVLYERRGLPCLIDTSTMTEELLGFGDSAKMSCAYSNQPLTQTVKWHPRLDRVAMAMIHHRKLSLIWVWGHGRGLRRFSEMELRQAVGRNPVEFVGPAGFFTDITGWKGHNLEFTLHYSVKLGAETTGHEAVLQWDSIEDRFVLVSDRVEG